MAASHFYIAEEAVQTLDVHSDKEDFEDAPIIVKEQSNISKADSDSDQEKDENIAASEAPPSFLSLNNTLWRQQKDAASVGRITRRNILRVRGGTKQFIYVLAVVILQ